MSIPLHPMLFSEGSLALAFVRHLRKRMTDDPERNREVEGLVAIYGPPLVELTGGVTVYATASALALIRRLDLEPPSTGPTVDMGELPVNSAVIFGRLPR